MQIKILLLIKQLLCSMLDIKLNTKTAYKLFKFIKQIENEEMFYNSKFKELLNTYGEKDDNGNFITDDKGNIKLLEKNVLACKKAINELDSLEVEIPNVSFTLDELEPLQLSVNQIILLQNFIQEEV